MVREAPIPFADETMTSGVIAGQKRYLPSLMAPPSLRPRPSKSAPNPGNEPLPRLYEVVRDPPRLRRTELPVVHPVPQRWRSSGRPSALKSAISAGLVAQIEFVERAFPVL